MDAKKKKLIIIGSVLSLLIIAMFIIFYPPSPQIEAKRIANGLFVAQGMNVQIQNTSNYTTFLTVKDFNYHGQLYFMVFYVPSNLIDSTPPAISPSSAYTKNGSIIKPSVEIGNSVPQSVMTTALYSMNFSVIYRGSVLLWETPPLSSPVAVSLTYSPPEGYTTVVVFFAHISNKYVEIAYQQIN